MRFSRRLIVLKQKLFFALILLCITISTFSQNDSVEVLNILTNNNHRQWLLEETVPVLGSRCKKGGYLIFFKKDQRAIQKDCDTLKGIWIVSEQKWSLRREGWSWYLLLNRNNYNIVIKRRSNGKTILSLKLIPESRYLPVMIKNYISD
jgi:hypothetical protein